MLNRPALLVACVLGLCASAGATAQKRTEPSPTPAVSQFVMGTRLGFITCSDKYRTFLEKQELYALMTEGQRAPQGTPPSDAEVSECIHQTSLRGTSLYKTALGATANPKARAAFSEYMVAWEAALKAIRKPQKETVQQFRARHKQTEDQLNTLQQKLEAAAPNA